MSKREQKIAEIREFFEKDYTVAAVRKMRAWFMFLLSELDHEREENRKLREERDFWKREAETWEKKYSDEKGQNVGLKLENERLREERDKLIEGLRWYGNKSNYVSDYNLPSNITRDRGQRARDILKELG